MAVTLIAGCSRKAESPSAATIAQTEAQTTAQTTKAETNAETKAEADAEAEIVEAAKRAEIYDDILDMPDGFQTQVGERGAMLSGGQKQRVSIARIFLKDPPVLILDEATSALDSVTEARIQSAFDELAKGRTTLIIAHRLSTIRSASRILVIDGNGIQEEGTHEELMAKGGEYAQLYLAQKSVSV